MSVQQLFGRAWSVTIGLSGQPGFQYTGMRTAFEIDKVATGASNKAKVELYNINALSRKLYQQASSEDLKNVFQLRLQAGYGDRALNIFLGDVRRVENKRNGVDIITTFECGSGEKSLNNAFVSKTYPAGSRFSMILLDLVNMLQLDVASVSSFDDETYNTPVVITGSVRDAITGLCDKKGLVWSVQDGRVYVISRGTTIGNSAIVISNRSDPARGLAVTGLIGVPSRNLGLVQFTSLLNPDIIPGAAVQVFSENIDGEFFKILRAKYEGDSHGEKWQVACEAQPITAITLAQSFSTTRTRGVAAV